MNNAEPSAALREINAFIALRLAASFAHTGCKLAAVLFNSKKIPLRL
jgi:hypothetical protein